MSACGRVYTLCDALAFPCPRKNAFLSHTLTLTAFRFLLDGVARPPRIDTAFSTE